MASSDISDIVIFKKKLGLNYEIKQKYVGLKMKENNILSFNFRVPSALRDEVLEYFNRFQMGEPTAVDIGGTGDIKCIFKGISGFKRRKCIRRLLCIVCVIAGNWKNRSFRRRIM